MSSSPRETEGRNVGVMASVKRTEIKKNRGRPIGSKNKPKSLIPSELANEMLVKLKPILPPEHYEYMRAVVKEGKVIAVERELDIIILLIGRQLWPAILTEMEGFDQPAAGEPANEDEAALVDDAAKAYFRKDVSERIKIWKDLVEVKLRNERARDEAADNSKKPILEIFARRGLDRERLRIGIEHVSGDMGGSPDGTGREADEARDVPVALSERPIFLPGSGESSTDRPLDNALD
jgi:hypothetical protein